MVYRYESDEDAFLEYPKPGSAPNGPAATTPPPAGPSRSRFPTPSLPPPPRPQAALPPAGAPEQADPDGQATADDARAPVPAPPAPAPTPGRPAPPREPSPVPQPAPPMPAPVPAATNRPTVPIPASPTARAADVSELPRTRRAERRGGGRFWQTLVGGAAVLLLLSLTGLAVAALLDERTATPPAGQPTPQPSESSTPSGATDLDSRDTDQAALTAKEVFPTKDLVLTDGKPAYRVLKTQASTKCQVAATGEIADLLVRLGCNQVVRGTLRSPDGDHLVTAGLFNLTDVATAQRVRDRIRPLLDQRQGRFRGMAAGDDTEAVERAAARVAWQVRGHYVAFCLVTRADGERIGSDDATAREIMYDLVELHLNRSVLDRRAAAGTAGQPDADSAGDSAGQRGTD
ncbi:hypothetical protein O7607_16045 [Micromonospora sp. WMMA1949]|uniref:hypothetical protein n=1 Tax=unclassified Micromonospora TaxID=2617518 RepID=UPI0022B705B7|nr:MULTISPECIES: hypothetical protein [unclassified Micromonospora]MCZ7427247.1 hypothetical protein [Micromonospora sp. WMMA1949]WBC11726.1 hypothetical protein O7604_12995 [Micromonospora sp. WMMA1947]